MLCLLGFHNWIFDCTTVRSCGSELEKVYRCSRCGEREYINCERCKHYGHFKCKYVSKENPECYRMKKK